MKRIVAIAALLTALLLAPIFSGLAGEAAPFILDEGRVLPGMSRSWRQGYEPTVARNQWTLLLPLLSTQASGPIRTELIPADEAFSPFRPQTMAVETPPSEEGVYAVRLTLALHADRRNGDYPCTLRITGETAAGTALRLDMPYTLRIRDGLPSTEAVRAAMSVAQSDLRVGEDGLITVALTNPCHTVTLEQPVLRIGDGSGEILPLDGDVLYLPDLAPGESRTVAFPVTVKPDASVSRHVLQLSLGWTALGQSMTQTESHTVPVTQEIRLEQGGVRMPASVVAGDPLTITLPLMNMGRADVINVLATVSLPGITDRQSVLVGVIAPGETKQAQLTLTPGREALGEFTGAVTVEATDSNGNPATLSLPIALTVEAPAPAAPDAPVRAQDTPMMTWCLGSACALLLVLCLVQGSMLRRKIRRLEEERL